MKNFSGTMTYSNGEVYSGGWDNNKRYGYGRLNSERETKWVNDMKLVRSKFEYPNGDIYLGEHGAGYKHGDGVIKYANGDVFKGKFCND